MLASFFDIFHTQFLQTPAFLSPYPGSPENFPLYVGPGGFVHPE